MIRYPDLPVSARRDDIAAAIRDHQVVIVSGETGSGKTTQLPKICLQLGRGVRGMIGHTQPRRLAARSVADRIAEELGQTVGREPGQVIGYQVRFTDEVGPTTLVKLMTDGILLAEIQSDPLLRRYDTLIIDEAHERSLNIDFLLGYLARLLPLRPDLKVVITSATIDSQRFAAHFGRWEGRPGKGRLIEPAPVIEVSGRTYPVEIRYRPLSEGALSQWSSSSPEGSPGNGTEADEGVAAPGTARTGVQQLVLEDPDDDLPSLGYGLGEEIDQETAICAAVDELCAEGPGDILVFLPGERDIRDTEQALADHLGARAITGRTDSRAPRGPDAIEILPLYARLTAAEQHRVFEPHGHRRVVLATNVAETSLTVPGIHYVIDPGLARISRYSNRTKVQRLPIERISQASANQRAGRSGRLADGIAIRLYSQADYESRPEFTEPEILRTSLASVILQMAALGLGDVGDFPFLDPPDARAVRDGIQLLIEIGALEEDRSATPGGYALTAIGRDLAALPIDPRLGRMLIEGDANGCASEVLVIVAALSIQDVRERPLEHQQAADAAHARFTDPHSDFITYLNLWRYLTTQARDLSGSAFRRMCRSEFLHYLRFREWRDVVGQLRQMARPLDLDLHPIGEPSPADVARAAAQGGIANATARAVVAFTDSANTVDADEIHLSLLVGLLSNLGNWDVQTRTYAGARGTRFTIWPGSGLARSHPDWVMTAELVETSRLFARTVARIRPEWIEPAAGGLVRRVYSEPFWSSAKGAAMVREKVLLYGLTLVADRPVLLGRLGEGVSFGGGTGSRSSVAAPGTLAGIAQGLVAAGAVEGPARRGDAERGLAPSTAIADALGAALGAALGSADRARTDTGDAPAGDDAPGAAGEAEPAPGDAGEAEEGASTAVTARELAREMFIRHALVGGEWRERHRFQQVNAERLEQAREVERRSRRMGLVAGEEALFAFFDDIVPEDVVSAGHFNGWWKRARRETPDLLVYPPGLLLPRGTGADPDAFPDHWASAGLRLALSYEFAPGSPRDGVTATVPVEVLPRVREDGADWLVPGMREELATGWIRALPKAKRRLLAPAPEVGAQVVAWIRGHVIGGGEAPGQEAAVAAPDGSGPAPAAGDPQSLDAAMARLARWGRASGQVVRAAAPTAPGRPDRQDAPARTPGDRRRGPVRTRGDEDGPGAPDTTGAPDATGPLPPFSRALAQAAAALRGVELSEADLAHAAGHLPDHLRMTFAVVDRHGAELGAGKDLAYLQRTLAGTADQAVRTAVRGAVAEAFADAEHRRRTSSPKGGGRGRRSRGERITGPLADGTAGQAAPPAAGASPLPPPALEADGLTAFPATALPRSLDTRDPATGLMLRGFPALVPQGDAAEPAAGIRILANPAEADRLHREGLARLLLLRVRLATARVTTRWTGREALMLAASPYGGTAALVADAQLASAVSLVDELTASPSSVREPQAFDQLAERARDLHEDRVHDLLGHVVRAMEALSEVQGAIREHPEVSLRAAVNDVEATTRSLIHPGFLLATPPWALPHLARYLRAGAVRVRRASGGAPALRRDAEAMRTVHEVERAIDDAAERAAQRPFDAARAHALTQARWMAQELRVSLFAQQLGTPQKVSAKRVLGLVGAEAVRS